MGHVLGKHVLQQKPSESGKFGCLGACSIRKRGSGLFDSSLQEYPNMERKRLDAPVFVVLVGALPRNIGCFCA